MAAPCNGRHLHADSEGTLLMPPSQDGYAPFARSTLEVVLVDGAALHHEADVL
jgi:hypothetical protein